MGPRQASAVRHVPLVGPPQACGGRARHLTTGREKGGAGARVSGCLQLRPGGALTGADSAPLPNAHARSREFLPPPPA
eukprot:6798696-Alexandrium_andersonii.AAC.1